MMTRQVLSGLIRHSRLALHHSTVTPNEASKILSRNFSSSSLLKNDKYLFGGPYKYISDLEFLEPKVEDVISTYRVMDPHGNILNQSQDPKFPDDMIMRMYKAMVLQNTLDNIMYDAQRQGRISFYMTNYGEEASQIGSAAALEDTDLVFGQYREAGVLMWRGFRLDQFMDQCYANKNDPAQGKQMPIHYGSKELNFVTISSPLATQMPQASGAAYALKRTHPGSCVICYFGEGAASEGDAHAAFNFAATLDAPCLFFCRNNGYAISTPACEQYRSDGIASRGSGYGMLTIRMDGNDLFAVFNTVRKAREISVKENRPVLIEAMTYRIGHHSTSDDSSTYRTNEEVAFWKQNYDPIERVKKYLINTRKLWSEDEDKLFIKSSRKEILDAFTKSEKVLKPSPSQIFIDVYDELTDNLKRQDVELKNHVSNYKEHYPLHNHEPFQ